MALANASGTDAVSKNNADADKENVSLVKTFTVESKILFYIFIINKIDDLFCCSSNIRSLSLVNLRNSSITAPCIMMIEN